VVSPQGHQIKIMTVHFYEPPPVKMVGGLDAFIQSLRRYLVGRDVSVRTNIRLDQLEFDQSDQVIHFHGLWQPQFLKFSKRSLQLGIPYVVSPHGMLEPWAWRRKYWKKLPYYYCFERAHLMNASMIHAASEKEAKSLSRFVPVDKIRTIPLSLTDGCGPDYSAARRKLGWRPDELILLYLSRIHPKKGLLLLLRALCGIAASMPAKWRLVVVGDGDGKYGSECQKCARSNPVVFRSTEWKGAVWGKEKWAYYQGSDLFCLPSFSENFGLAVLEACQVGTRILTTHETPWSFLEDGRTAFLVEAKVESIQQGLLSFLQRTSWNHDDRDDLSQRIHARFDWSRIGPQYIELYQQLAYSSGSCTAVPAKLPCIR
jgi:glycosyltransferase involved in cell wall biosynthesis